MTVPQPPRAPIDLRRPRDIGGLVSDGFGLYFREFRTFIAIAAAVVVPVQLIVSGAGLGELSGRYDAKPTIAEQLIPAAAQLLVIMPLTTAMCIYALLDLAEGKQPSVASSIQRGLDIFAPLLLVMLMYAAGAALGLAALIVPGIYIAVRWGLAVQSVVVDGRRGADALRRSWALVEGSWWRVFGVTIAFNFLAGGIASIIALPFISAAQSSGSAVYQLVGQTIGAVVTAAPVALMTTLLYFDQRLRKGT
jgi:hypothetical protein